MYYVNIHVEFFYIKFKYLLVNRHYTENTGPPLLILVIHVNPVVKSILIVRYACILFIFDVFKLSILLCNVLH